MQLYQHKKYAKLTVVFTYFCTFICIPRFFLNSFPSLYHVNLTGNNDVTLHVTFAWEPSSAEMFLIEFITGFFILLAETNKKTLV